ncbi:hypothetical protein DO021_06610 [Desulfobacter hydrogenophilus]|uniref:Histidine kinase/HSP90-like ATPase domain-containing protein n=1 Tax=Desulfobacter hydrogenophilus TaxID=2291 RepID=A0A328FFT6_9BACT|nr:hypothetical protein [Desulfobacter hydrogenophilus]QBH15043.1 hypothetical protein EYB58_20245 [Desulfobacter hydrogenophilus]RAM02710.1 hypothetical protein DO021_06610 [Desulfobacter hydrogenophilus]
MRTESNLQFSPRGGEIGVTLKRSGETVVVEIRDQGPGIPEFVRDKIFDRFFIHPAPGHAQEKYVFRS